MFNGSKLIMVTICIPLGNYFIDLDKQFAETCCEVTAAMIRSKITPDFWEWWQVSSQHPDHLPICKVIFGEDAASAAHHHQDWIHLSSVSLVAGSDHLNFWLNHFLCGCQKM